MQILKFLAEVAEVAARHFDDATPHAPAGEQKAQTCAGEPKAPPRTSEPKAQTCADEHKAAPRPGEQKAQPRPEVQPGASGQKAPPRPGERSQSSTLECVVEALQTPDATRAALHEVLLALTAQVEARRKTERDLVVATEALAAERATSDRLRAEIVKLQRTFEGAREQGHAAEALTAERATSDRLRTELVELHHAHEHAAEALAAERATSDRLRAELVEIQHALASAPPMTRGRDIEAELEIDFVQMLCGATLPLAVEVSGEIRTIDVEVPPGVVDGTVLVLGGRGEVGEPRGDVLVRVRVLPHPTLTRDGNDIAMRVPLSPEVFAHTKMSVDTAEGSVTVPLAPDRLGENFRFEGKGIATGDGKAGTLLITFDTAPLLDASIEQFPSAATAFAVLGSLAPPARAHLTTLANSAQGSTSQRAIREVLWALAVAHERGERGPLRGFAAQLTADLIVRGFLRASDVGRRSHVFAWLGNRSPLFTRERSIESPNLLWTVHLDRLADAGRWTQIESHGVTRH